MLMYRSDKLQRTFYNTLGVVKKRNMTNLPIPEHLQLPVNVDGFDEGSAKPTRSETCTVVEADEPSGNVGKKTMRSQMMDDDKHRLDTPTSNNKSRGASITPADEEQIRSFVYDYDCNDDREEQSFLLRNTQDGISRHGDRTTTYHPQRSLRSSQLVVRSTSPFPERWTKKNPDWIEEHDWKTPLMYERTTVNCGDIACLDEGQFLNDAIISFYAKYLHKQLEKKDENSARKVYIFNSFFWETLRAKGYDGVKSWTAKIDLLSYDYIIVPINQHTHWYMAIICNPGALILRDEPDGEVDEINEIVDGRHEDEGALSDTTPEAKVANVTSDLSQVSIEDYPDSSTAGNLDEVNGKSRAKRTKSSKRRAPARKYHPKEPRVINLDSLDGRHPAVARQLKTYLSQEIKERKGLDISTPSHFGITAKDIPIQQNFTDCGVYLLAYIEEFMKDPHKFTRRILQQQGRDWDVNAPDLRNKIRTLILELHKTQQEADKLRRRAKKSLGNPRAKTRNLAITDDLSAKSSTDGAQTDRKASRSPAVDRQNTNSSTGSPALRVNGNGNMYVNDKRADWKTSRSSSSTPRAQPSSPAQSASIEDCEIANVNASMIVNPNASVELDNERSQNRMGTAPCNKNPAQTQNHYVHETPKPKRSSESRQTSVSRQASGSRQSSESRQTPRAQLSKGDYDTRSFLPLLNSSPPGSPAPASRQDVKRRGAFPVTDLGKRVTPKQDETRRGCFTSSSSSSTLRSSGAKTTHSGRRDGATQHNYHAIDSSDIEETENSEKRRHKTNKPSIEPHIDLTTED